MAHIGKFYQRDRRSETKQFLNEEQERISTKQQDTANANKNIPVGIQHLKCMPLSEFCAKHNNFCQRRDNKHTSYKL